MTTTEISPPGFKQVLKEALAEALLEQRGPLREIFLEVIEDVAFMEAIRAGQQTGRVDRNAVMAAL